MRLWEASHEATSFFFGLAVEIVFVERNSMKANNIYAISAN